MFGILGGTFDPIHCGHLVLAEKAREAFQLEKVIVVPAAIPPHKIGEVATEACHRLKMVELAIRGNPWFEVSTVELDREGPSYSIDTIYELRKTFGSSETALIMGFDSLLELYSWKNYRSILAETKIITAFRPGYPILSDDQNWPSFLEDYRSQILKLEAPLLDISSTWLRVELMLGRSVKYLVPDLVIDYINSNGLYRDL
ncbi:MAG: nicotinate-nucleotide adenylyltransferase [Firmicutes bacterium]|nr:nicotinate-nucleotide adenylyltransferase [Bacillota bacterium]